MEIDITKKKVFLYNSLTRLYPHFIFRKESGKENREAQTLFMYSEYQAFLNSKKFRKYKKHLSQSYKFLKEVYLQKNIMKKICIPTNDKQTIAQRTGRAKGFMFYTIDDNKKIIEEKYIDNPHSHDHNHDEEEEHEHHHNEIIEILQDVDIFVVKAVGKHLRQDLIDANINFERTSKTEIKDILNDYI